MVKAKPFIKWVGGKGQLIEQLEALLPADFDERDHVTYIEPFVGGGSMLFYMLQAHPNIVAAIINDINADLAMCYRVVRDNPAELVGALSEIQKEYHAFTDENVRRDFFVRQRERFNTKALGEIENTMLFFFLNRTCFNGLYRVNKAGKFNVPFGKHISPTICDAPTIYADSRLLQNVEILTGDFEETFEKIHGDTLFYFDPPYRPLSNTSSFNDYAKESFNDDTQRRLKAYCDKIHNEGCLFMLSNSDCLGKDGKDRFFDDLYADYEIERVWASRNINAVASKRGKLTEILVHNYQNTKKRANKSYSLFYEPNNPVEGKVRMEKGFNEFMSQLKETNQTLGFFCDFKKISQHVKKIEINLNILNYLIGKQDMEQAVRDIWERDKTAFGVVDILIAVRDDGKKKIVNASGDCVPLKSFFTSVESVLEYLNTTGLTALFQNNRIKDLVDYVFGIETGLDTNARKNRSGDIMEDTVDAMLTNNGIKHKREVYSRAYPPVALVLGDDEKRFDFAIETGEKTYLMEVNFYSTGGSKLNEVARAYSEIALKINNVPGFEFVWITDGIGWRAARNKLQEAYSVIPKLYNLTNVTEFIKVVKY